MAVMFCFSPAKSTFAILLTVLYFLQCLETMGATSSSTLTTTDSLTSPSNTTPAGESSSQLTATSGTSANMGTSTSPTSETTSNATSTNVTTMDSSSASVSTSSSSTSPTSETTLDATSLTTVVTTMDSSSASVTTSSSSTSSGTSTAGNTSSSTASSSSSTSSSLGSTGSTSAATENENTATYIIVSVSVGFVLVGMLVFVLMFRHRRRRRLRKHTKPNLEGRYSTLTDVKSETPYDRFRQRNTHELWDINLNKDQTQTTAPESTAELGEGKNAESLIPNGNIALHEENERSVTRADSKKKEQARKGKEEQTVTEENQPTDRHVHFILEPEAGAEDQSEVFGREPGTENVRHSDLYRDDSCPYYTEIDENDEAAENHKSAGNKPERPSVRRSRGRSTIRKDRRPYSEGDYEELEFGEDGEDEMADLEAPTLLTVTSLPILPTATCNRGAREAPKPDADNVDGDNDSLYENFGNVKTFEVNPSEDDPEIVAPSSPSDKDGDGPMTFNARHGSGPTKEGKGENTASKTDHKNDDDYYNLQMLNDAMTEKAPSTSTKDGERKDGQDHATDDDDIQMIDNELYVSADGVTTDKDKAAAPSPESDDDDEDLQMIDNDVYESADMSKRTKHVKAGAADSKDSEDDEAEMIDNELYGSSADVAGDASKDNRNSTNFVSVDDDYDELVMQDSVLNESSENTAKNITESGKKVMNSDVIEDDYDVIDVVSDEGALGSREKELKSDAEKQISGQTDDEEPVMIDNDLYESADSLGLVPKQT